MNLNGLHTHFCQVHKMFAYSFSLYCFEPHWCKKKFFASFISILITPLSSDPHPLPQYFLFTKQSWFFLNSHSANSTWSHVKVIGANDAERQKERDNTLSLPLYSSEKLCSYWPLTSRGVRSSSCYTLWTNYHWRGRCYPGVDQSQM